MSLLTIILTHLNNSKQLNINPCYPFSIPQWLFAYLPFIQSGKVEVRIFNSMQIHMFIINICPLGKQNIIEYFNKMMIKIFKRYAEWRTNVKKIAFVHTNSLHITILLTQSYERKLCIEENGMTKLLWAHCKWQNV